MRKGQRHSDKTKHRIAETLKKAGYQPPSSKGRRRSGVTRHKMSEAHKGVKHSEESKRKIGEAKRGRNLSSEHKRKISETRKGKTEGHVVSKETREKISRRNQKLGSSNYRKRAFEFFGYKCQRCGKELEEDKLVVHHKDLDNITNHSIENLMVLCKDCHRRLHRELSGTVRKFVGLTSIEKGTLYILKGLNQDYGLDIRSEHFRDTAKRVARSYAEIFEGLKDTDHQVEEIISTAFKSKADQMILIDNIEVFSMCPHHFLPVQYDIAVAYIPHGYVLGLSKLARLAEFLAKRPVIQEDLTTDIAEKLMLIKPRGVAVRIRGMHLCMRMRGVKKSCSVVTTSSVLGAFREESSTREEFFNLIGKGTIF